MDKLKIARCNVLGGFQIFDQTGAEIRFPIVKGAAIIVYLSLRSGNQASRGELSGLFWGDKPEATARTSLRQCLHKMRSKLEDFEPNFLTFTSNSVSLDRTKLGLDTDLLVNPDRIMDLAYPGEVRTDQFLLGFEDLDPSFSEWLWNQRTKLDERFRVMLKSILLDEKAEHPHQLRAAQHLNILDPSEEVAARFLIEEAASENDLVSLLRVYQKHWDALGEEWGEEPSSELQALVGEIRARLGEAPNSELVKLNVTPIRRYVSILAISMRSTHAKPVSIDTLLKMFKETISSLNGTIIASQAGKLCAAFGLEGATENSARDAIEAALNIKALLGSQYNLKVGIGIDTGFVLAKPAESSMQQPEITGSIVGQAEELANADGEFTILVTERTAHGIKSFYRVEHETHESASASDVMRVFGRSSAVSVNPSRGRRETFVGRAPFLAALWEIWTEGLASRSLQIASIQGPAGIGKTRLVDELMRRLAAEGVCTARAVCNPYDRSSPFEPMYELLKALKSIPVALNQEIEQAQNSESPSTIDAIVTELSNTLASEPSAIFIDDWQWADDATRLALSKLVTKQLHKPLMLVLTSRNVPADEWLVMNSHQFVLPSFTSKEIVERAELLLEKPIDEKRKQQIITKSGGNPLFLEEVCHAIESSSSGWMQDEVIVAPLANLQGLFASRFEQLAHEELEILFAVAVYGDRVELELLSKILAPRSISPELLDSLYQKDILINADMNLIRFKHSLARDVIYNMIPEEKRQVLHRSYAEHLRVGITPEKEHQLVEALAFHYRGCGDIANASEFSERSGDKALAASALDQAIRHYSLALDLIAQLPMDEATRKRLVSLSIRWAIPVTYAPSYEQLPILERAEMMAKQMGDLHSVAAVRYWIGYFTYVLGEKEQSLESFKTAKEIADAVGNVRQSVEITAIEGCLLASMAQYDEAEFSMREALKIKDLHSGKNGKASVTSVYTRANLALVRADRGDFEEAQALIDEALFKVRGFEHEVESSILLFAGTINIWRGAWEIAIEEASRSRERSEKVSSPYLMGMSRCIWGYSHWKLDHNKVGLDTLVRNARWMQDRGMAMYYTFIGGWLADALVDAGRHKEAEAAYLDTQDRALCGEIAGMAMACRATAFSSLLDGNFDMAQARLSEAKEIAERRKAAHEFAANDLLYAQLYHAQGCKNDALIAANNAKQTYAQLGLEHRYRMACDIEAMLSS